MDPNVGVAGAGTLGDGDDLQAEPPTVTTGALPTWPELSREVGCVLTLPPGSWVVREP